MQKVLAPSLVPDVGEVVELGIRGEHLDRGVQGGGLTIAGAPPRTPGCDKAQDGRDRDDAVHQCAVEPHAMLAIALRNVQRVLPVRHHVADGGGERGGSEQPHDPGAQRRQAPPHRWPEHLDAAEVEHEDHAGGGVIGEKCMILVIAFELRLARRLLRPSPRGLREVQRANRGARWRGHALRQLLGAHEAQLAARHGPTLLPIGGIIGRVGALVGQIGRRVQRLLRRVLLADDRRATLGQGRLGVGHDRR
mmetsp:Transcript_12396/g.35460  ORF Transcript_12396/g.35460 Transcript_12396/m.35460 type:complete len:250 (-) Transcript_12396:964-1713(-)